jgi:multiple sugar transport system substrate-binding protein
MKKAITMLLIVIILSSITSVMAQDEGCTLEAPADDVEVNMLGHAFPITEFFAEEMESCSEVDNLEVSTQLMDSAGAEEQMMLALSGGGDSPWGILHLTPGRIVKLNDVDALLPLNDLVEKYWDEYNLDEIPQTVWDSATIDGNIYGVPFISNTFILMYRADLFEKYELEAPTTYDEVMAACEVLAEEDSIDMPFTLNLHAGWAWEIEYSHFIGSFGGQYINEDNTPAFNSEEGIAGLAKMKEVVDACMGQEGLTYSIDDSEIGMEVGSIAFINVWASRAPGMDDPEKSDFVGMINFAPAPAPDPEGKLGGSAWIDAYSIPVNTDVDPDLAFRIIMETVDYDSQVAGSELGLVTRTAVGEAGYGGRELAAVAETVADGVGYYPMVPAAQLARNALGNWLPLVGTGEMTPEEALSAAEEEYIAEATAQGYLGE